MLIKKNCDKLKNSEETETDRERDRKRPRIEFARDDGIKINYITRPVREPHAARGDAARIATAKKQPSRDIELCDSAGRGGCSPRRAAGGGRGDVTPRPVAAPPTGDRSGRVQRTISLKKKTRFENHEKKKYQNLEKGQAFSENLFANQRYLGARGRPPYRARRPALAVFSDTRGDSTPAAHRTANR
ncbi:hypothetical protein EVAR_45552_1 [Eumeta japonica]|uniref:Uncharacterized protein n=1 Tax=Eumeta variegata TaxID=151549 RepID=A0A4C1X901_EUMVA|nr:hypothetical protein EVAR_45552_1 [Eumeta japonica]